MSMPTLALFKYDISVSGTNEYNYKMYILSTLYSNLLSFM